jgi:hypothetical protein
MLIDESRRLEIAGTHYRKNSREIDQPFELQNGTIGDGE